ncbi:uncharacterized protein LOC116620212 isoform X1 [Nematostella vectensis]|uniref:uncharacterized protein LOC116620212 isoform X1 n=1 Tax=Nematostella vectensis TaxID=45351 RepID=UPI002076DF84|nr:uncharacterized protein LOC116620212 isoform X1 [Nematostella vectensis]
MREIPNNRGRKLLSIIDKLSDRPVTSSLDSRNNHEHGGQSQSNSAESSSVSSSIITNLTVNGCDSDVVNIPSIALAPRSHIMALESITKNIVTTCNTGQNQQELNLSCRNKVVDLSTSSRSQTCASSAEWFGRFRNDVDPYSEKEMISDSICSDTVSSIPDISSLVTIVISKGSVGTAQSPLLRMEHGLCRLCSAPVSSLSDLITHLRLAHPGHCAKGVKTHGYIGKKTQPTTPNIPSSSSVKRKALIEKRDGLSLSVTKQKLPVAQSITSTPRRAVAMPIQKQPAVQSEVMSTESGAVMPANNSPVEPRQTISVINPIPISKTQPAGSSTTQAITVLAIACTSTSHVSSTSTSYVSSTSTSHVSSTSTSHVSSTSTPHVSSKSTSHVSSAPTSHVSSATRKAVTASTQTSGPVMCERCNKWFGTDHLLKFHMAETHSEAAKCLAASEMQSIKAAKITQSLLAQAQGNPASGVSPSSTATLKTVLLLTPEILEKLKAAGNIVISTTEAQKGITVCQPGAVNRQGQHKLATKVSTKIRTVNGQGTGSAKSSEAVGQGNPTATCKEKSTNSQGSGQGTKDTSGGTQTSIQQKAQQQVSTPRRAVAMPIQKQPAVQSEVMSTESGAVMPANNSPVEPRQTISVINPIPISKTQPAGSSTTQAITVLAIACTSTSHVSSKSTSHVSSTSTSHVSSKSTSHVSSAPTSHVSSATRKAVTASTQTSGPVMCERCNKWFGTDHLLKFHMAETHSEAAKGLAASEMQSIKAAKITQSLLAQAQGNPASGVSPSSTATLKTVLLLTPEILEKLKAAGNIVISTTEAQKGITVCQPGAVNRQGQHKLATKVATKIRTVNGQGTGSANSSEAIGQGNPTATSKEKSTNSQGSGQGTKDTSGGTQTSIQIKAQQQVDLSNKMASTQKASTSQVALVRRGKASSVPLIDAAEALAATAVSVTPTASIITAEETASMQPVKQATVPRKRKQVLVEAVETNVEVQHVTAHVKARVPVIEVDMDETEEEEMEEDENWASEGSPSEEESVDFDDDPEFEFKGEDIESDDDDALEAAVVPTSQRRRRSTRIKRQQRQDSDESSGEDSEDDESSSSDEDDDKSTPELAEENEQLTRSIPCKHCEKLFYWQVHLRFHVERKHASISSYQGKLAKWNQPQNIQHQESGESEQNQEKLVEGQEQTNVDNLDEKKDKTDQEQYKPEKTGQEQEKTDQELEKPDMVQEKQDNEQEKPDKGQEKQYQEQGNPDKNKEKQDREQEKPDKDLEKQYQKQEKPDKDQEKQDREKEKPDKDQEKQDREQEKTDKEREQPYQEQDKPDQENTEPGPKQIGPDESSLNRERDTKLADYQQKNTPANPNYCDHCDRTFLLKEALRLHIKKVVSRLKGKTQKIQHEELEDEPDDIRPKRAPRKLACQQCGSVFAQRRGLERHILFIHTNQTPVKCSVCEKWLRNEYALIGHNRIEHAVRNFVCQHCGKKLASKKTLKCHLQHHTGELPYKCRFCDKRFGKSNSLFDHENRHTGELPFKCVVCGKAFISPQALGRHALVHSDDKPFKCDVCDKSFKSAYAQRVHKRSHTDDKPFKCDTCGRKFNQKICLTLHLPCREEELRKKREEARKRREEKLAEKESSKSRNKRKSKEQRDEPSLKRSTATPKKTRKTAAKDSSEVERIRGAGESSSEPSSKRSQSTKGRKNVNKAPSGVDGPLSDASGKSSKKASSKSPKVTKVKESSITSQKAPKSSKQSSSKSTKGTKKRVEEASSTSQKALPLMTVGGHSSKEAEILGDDKTEIRTRRRTNLKDSEPAQKMSRKRPSERAKQRQQQFKKTRENNLGESETENNNVSMDLIDGLEKLRKEALDIDHSIAEEDSCKDKWAVSAAAEPLNVSSATTSRGRRGRSRNGKK